MTGSWFELVNANGLEWYYFEGVPGFIFHRTSRSILPENIFLLDKKPKTYQ
jgi:hypothetical protein